MAKRISTGKTSTKSVTKTAQVSPPQPVTSQPPLVMNPLRAAPAESQTVNITHEMIAQKAFEIWKSQGGSDLENWLRAERELRTDGAAWSMGK